jgi:hypothetical protein
MALKVTRFVSEWYVNAPFADRGKASRFYISVSSRYLSEAYGLGTGDEVSGVIQTVGLSNKEYAEFAGKPITFIVWPFMGTDNLGISKKNWEEFREWGLVESGYALSVSLNEALRAGEEKATVLYSKADKVV